MENIPNPNPPIQETPNPAQPPVMPTSKLVFEKAGNVATNLFNKFYSNKKIFWPVTIFFGLILFITLIGLLFGQKPGQPVILPRATASPFSLSTPIASPSSEFLGGEYQKLLNLRGRLELLDVKQRDLSPPSLNFDVKF